jgi:phage anti-repressor protein
MQKPTQQLAHVYAIQNELGLVKIGYAHNPAKRFKAIEANSGLKLVESYVSPVCFNFAEIEKSLHNQFAGVRKAGEWFSVDFNIVKNAIDTHFLTVDSHELTTPALKALIPISQTQIGTDTVQSVDARELHTWLESKQEFANWIKSRIDKYDFVEGQDYCLINLSSNEYAGVQTRVDYLISLDMAKELSMVERTAKGKEARQYFIACEKALRNPGQSLNESTKAFIYAAVKQVVVEAMQTAQEAIPQEVSPQPKPIPSNVSKTIVEWFDERVVINHNTSTKVGSVDQSLDRLYPNYCDFCNNHNYTPVSVKSFSPQLKRLCATKDESVTRSKGYINKNLRGSHFKGLQLKEVQS